MDLPTALRFLFHDAVDANNLLYKSSKGWVPVQDKAGDYGGVDLCLYSPLEGGRPKPGHNRNLAIPFYGGKLCDLMCAKAGRNGICAKGKESCAADVTVMGSIIALERVGVKNVEISWGRKKGNCSHPMVTPFTKNRKQMINYKTKPAIGFAPGMTGMDDPDSFHKVFAKLGFSPAEHVALMGAHSVGKVRPCADGLNGVEVGPFCNNPKKLDPPLTEDNFVPKCKPKPWIVSNCWSKPGNGNLRPIYAYSHTGKVETWRNQAIKTLKSQGYTTKKDLKAVGHVTKAWENITWTGSNKKGIGDGGFWDRTPQKFDNDYFKLFVGEKFDGKYVCCGSSFWNGKYRECKRTGTMVRNPKPHSITMDSWCKDCEKSEEGCTGDCEGYGKDAKSLLLGLQKGYGSPERVGPCDKDVNWCRDDRKGRQHMKSTKAWHEPLHSFLKKGHHHGTTMRLVRLPGDWALLSKPTTVQIMNKFAEDEEAFFKTFGEAWTKVVTMGYGGKLKKCANRVSNIAEKRMIISLMPNQGCKGSGKNKVCINPRDFGKEEEEAWHETLTKKVKQTKPTSAPPTNPTTKPTSAPPTNPTTKPTPAPPTNPTERRRYSPALKEKEAAARAAAKAAAKAKAKAKLEAASAAAKAKAKKKRKGGKGRGRR